MRRLLVLLWLLPLSLSAAPYIISPTNDPGVIGQQLFTTGVQGYHYWDWGTNVASSNATVLVASPSIGVTTNSPGSYTPFWSATMTNWLGTLLSQGTNNSTLTSNGVFSVFNDGTNKSYGYTRTINAQGTNFTTATSNLLWLQITNRYIIAGANVTVTTNVSGQTISYTIASTGGGSTTNVFIAAGANVTVTTNVVGSSTIYTIAASSGSGIAAAAGVDMLLTTNAGVVTFNFNTNATGISTLTGTNGAVIQFGGTPVGTMLSLSNSQVANGATMLLDTNDVLTVSSNGVNGYVVGNHVGGGGGLTNLPFTVSGAGLETTNANGINNVLVSNAVPIGSASVQIATNPVAGGITYTFTATAGSVSSTNAASYFTTNGTSVGTSGAITNIGFWTSTSGQRLVPFGTNLGSGQINFTFIVDNSTNNDTVVSNGVFTVFNDGTNVLAGYARTLSANNTNNATVVSNGLVVLVTVKSISIPLAAWYTNNDVVLPNTPATPIAFSNISSGFQFSSQNSNEIHCAFSLGSGWDGSAIRVRLKTVSLGTNSIFTTNDAWRVGAYCIPPLTSYTNNLTPNFVWGTNNVPPTLAYQRGNDCVTVDLTPAGTLDPTNTIFLSVRRESSVSGAGGAAWITRQTTNTTAMIDDVIVYYKGTNTLAMPTPNP